MGVRLSVYINEIKRYRLQYRQTYRATVYLQLRFSVFKYFSLYKEAAILIRSHSAFLKRRQGSIRKSTEKTADEAKIYYAQLNPKSGELDSDELEAVSGGGCNDSDDSGSNVKDVVTLYNEVSGLACPKCGQLNCWTLTTVNYYNNGINYWKCNYCGKEVMTLNSENNSILH